MYIKDMFLKDINRDIKGVIKVGQDDDKNVKQELEEYVVTKELQKHFGDFFESYRKGIVGNTDKMGVWISGFFGSGKSHFLKILSYLLANREVEGKKAIDYFIDDNKIKSEKVLENMKLATNATTDAILFNIDSKSGMADSQDNKEAILSVFLKVFNEHLGFYGGNPHIADLERNLIEEGKYEEFKRAFKEIRGREWIDSRHQFRFIQDDVCKALVDIGRMSEESAKRACESFTQPYNLDIHTFSKMVKRYIEKQGENHHVVFLVDEIGQYIGEKVDLMLNLQTVAEDLGTQCRGKAWIVVTSQQDIDSITKVRGNDFSKIQGRFDTRLSLSSANVDEVIKKRILDKKEVAKQTLELLYDEKETIIKNLIVFNDEVEKKLYLDREDFSLVYPYVPYQFNLLGDVLTSIRTHGASGKHLAEGERSMLALFKESAMKVMDKSEGTIVPFNMFYDALEQFLDHRHKGVIIRALENEQLNPEKSEDCFEINILKTLFMIKYVKEIVANIENITSLMVSSIDDDRIALKEKVEKALKKLMRQTLIEKNGQVYIFLTDEEQEISREIENQHVESAEITKKVSELIFEDLYSEKRYVYPSHNKRYTFGFRQLLDSTLYKGNQNYNIELNVLTPYYGETDETTLKMKTGQDKSVIVVLPDDGEFLEEIRSALKIEKFIRLNTNSNLPKYEEIKITKSNEMSEKNKNARIFLIEALENSTIYVNGDKLESNSKDIKKRIDEALGKLVASVFHKISYIDTPMNETSIKEVLKEKQNQNILIPGLDKTPNILALNDALEFININTQRHTKTSFKTIKERFLNAPYGFIEDDVKWIVAKLFMRGDISLYINSEIITLFSKTADEIYSYITSKSYSERLLIEKREKASEKQKKAVKEVMDELFKVPCPSEEDDTIFRRFKDYSKGLKEELKDIEYKYREDMRYPGKNIIKSGIELIDEIIEIKNSTEFFKAVDKYKDDFLDFNEDYEPIKAFFNGDQINIWNKAIHFTKTFNESKAFIVNREIEEVVNKIEAIMIKGSPYSDIRKMPELLDDFNRIYGELLDETAEPTLNFIDDCHARVTSELQGKECENILSLKVNKTFSDLREKTRSSTNIATLKNINLEADALKINLINEIEREEAKFIIKEEPVKYEKDYIKAPKGKQQESTKVRPEIKVMKVQTTKTMSIRSINTERTWRIKSESDVDKYIESLRRKIKENLKEDTILNIEF